jgi:signal peptidase I
MAEKGGSGGNWFTRWRKSRRAKREARHLIKEARRILRKHGYRLKEDVIEDVSKATLALKAALAEKRFPAIRDRLEKLDELVDKHLAFARKSALREYAESIGVAVLVALLLRAFVVEAFKIPSGSMIPTLKIGDHIFVNKFIYGLRVPFTHIKWDLFRKPRRGEVIVFVYPQDESKDFIKRIVAIEGDTVAVERNVVLINGKPIPRRPLAGPCIYPDAEEGSERWEPRPCHAFLEELDGVRYRVIHDVNSFSIDRKPVRVPAGHVFVMGDNRDNSHDSRFWGTVPDELIKGKAMIIWWSSGDPDGIRWRRFFDLVHTPPDPAKDPIQIPAAAEPR